MINDRSSLTPLICLAEHGLRVLIWEIPATVMPAKGIVGTSVALVSDPVADHFLTLGEFCKRPGFAAPRSAIPAEISQD